MPISPTVPTSPTVIPLHPQPSPGEPAVLRWITPDGVLPFTGPVATAPGPLARLIDDGTLAEVRLESRAVVTTLAADRTWPVDGARVRTALHAAVAEPAGWRADPGPGPCAVDDVRLRTVAGEVIDGEAGEFARSHGGTIELVDVRDGTVDVRLSGACHGCPASGTTLRVRLEEQIRGRCGGAPVRVREVTRRPGLNNRFGATWWHG